MCANADVEVELFFMRLENAAGRMSSTRRPLCCIDLRLSSSRKRGLLLLYVP